MNTFIRLWDPFQPSRSAIIQNQNIDFMLKASEKLKCILLVAYNTVYEKAYSPIQRVLTVMNLQDSSMIYLPSKNSQKYYITLVSDIDKNSRSWYLTSIRSRLGI